jgi:hypothetical protein
MKPRVREAGVLAAAGGVLGAAVGLLLYLVSDLRGPQTTYYGTHVPMQGLESSPAYTSTLSISVDPSTPAWLRATGVCAAAGILLGLLVFGTLVLTKRRIAVVSGSSPTG